MAMETESYDNYAEVETRKRPLDDASNGREKKRAVFRTDQPLLKLLVPNYAAGALIGKGGSLIAEMQEKFGGSIRLSANREFYPGTDERIVVISCSEVSQLLDYNSHIMEKVKIDQNMPVEKRPRNESRGHQVKIVLTNSAAGLLIGKGGATIKAIQENTKAKITIGSRDEAPVPGERVLTMSGTEDQRSEGCRQVIEIIAEEPTNMANHQVKYMGASMGMNMNSAGNFGMGGQQNQSSFSNNAMSGYRGANNMNSLGNLGMGGNQAQPLFSNNAMSGYQGANNMNTMGNLDGGGHQNQSNGFKLKSTVQVQMNVPNALVGGIMGKQGQIMRELIQISGAKIRFSAKDEFAPGTTDRILTISGDMHQVHTAYDLVNQRAEEVESELSNMPRR